MNIDVLGGNVLEQNKPITISNRDVSNTILEEFKTKANPVLSRII